MPSLDAYLLGRLAGDPAEALWILVEGGLDVSREQDGVETALAPGGAPVHVGEPGLLHATRGRPRC